jgi:hypothetical protein
MKTKSKYPFTAKQFKALTEEERQAVLAVAEYLTSSTTKISNEGLSAALNMMKESEGCVPYEEAGDDLLAAVRRRFAALYNTAMELAEAELKQRGFVERKHFNFCLVIEPSCDDTTHVTIVDYDQPICYLHECSKAWHLGFKDLAELAGAVLATKAGLVKKVEDHSPKKMFVVQHEGRVRELVGLPPHTEVTIINYDIEDEEKEYLRPSPLDGELCLLTPF